MKSLTLISILFISLSFAQAGHHRKAAPQLEIIDVGMRPESIVRGFNGDLFVGIMNGREPGDGEVRRIHKGEVSPFAKGLSEPKGIVFVGGFLITSDLTEIVKIDAEGNVSTLAAPEAFPHPVVYLNDVAAAPDGNGVYVTDMGDRDNMRGDSGLWPLESEQAEALKLIGRVYHIDLKGKVTEVISPDRSMVIPNGVGVANDGSLLVGGFFTGNLVHFKDDERSILADGMRGADAVEQHKNGNYYVSSWTQGKVWKVSPKGKKQVLAKGFQSAADFYLDEKKNILYLPDMLAGKVYAIKL